MTEEQLQEVQRLLLARKDLQEEIRMYEGLIKVTPNDPPTLKLSQILHRVQSKNDILTFDALFEESLLDAITKVVEARIRDIRNEYDCTTKMLLDL